MVYWKGKERGISGILKESYFTIGLHRSGNGQGKKSSRSGNFIWSQEKLTFLKKSKGKLK